jgi:ribosome biogenesis GTPase / thiamine phosphate phosphatase
MESITKLGWNEHWESLWLSSEYGDFIPGRVVADFGSNYRVAIPDEISAEVSGRLQYHSERQEMPKVGDWVAVQTLEEEHGVIHGVLPRKSEIARKQAGDQFSKQILAVNIDVAFLVQALDHDFSPDRIQRYLFQLTREGIEPVIILNKSDKESNLEAKLNDLASFNVKIIVTSAVSHNGIDEIIAAILPGKTAVFLGSSGVGKSTITNLLLGEEKQATQAIRETDSKGRHTTTHRELFVLPHGGMVIDTPGIRELQLWGAEDDLETAFSDIEALAKNCQFANCTHGTEPNCAIQAAIRSKTLDGQRFAAYQKFESELKYLNTKIDSHAARARKQSHKKAQKRFNQILRTKDELES